MSQENEKQGTFNFDPGKETNTSNTGPQANERTGETGTGAVPDDRGNLKRALIFIACLLVVLTGVTFLTITFLSPEPVEEVSPTMEDSKIQGEKLREKRQKDEKNLEKMRDRLIENPESEKNTFAKDVIKEFEQIYEDAKRKREEQKQSKKTGGDFEKNLGRYKPFDASRYHQDERTAVPIEKKEKRSMVVVSGSEKEIAGGRKVEEIEQRLDRVVASLEKSSRQNPTGVDRDISKFLDILATGREQGDHTRQVDSQLSRKQNHSVTLSYNSEYPIVTLFEGEYLEGVINTEIRSDIQEGPVIARTTRDFYDDSGNYVIIPYGTKVIGRTQAIGYKGQKRLYIWFERIILPTRIAGERPASINLPTRAIGLDRHGTTGLVSGVNRHFWLRYGSALLFGVVDGLMGVAQGVTRPGNENNPVSVVIDGTGQKIAGVNTSIYREYENIMPTVTVKAGSKVKIYIDCDIHITAYDLTANRPYARVLKKQYKQER